MSYLRIRSHKTPRGKLPRHGLTNLHLRIFALISHNRTGMPSRDTLTSKLTVRPIGLYNFFFLILSYCILEN